MTENSAQTFALLDVSNTSSGHTAFKLYSPSDFIRPLSAAPNFSYVTAADGFHTAHRTVESNHQTWVLLSEFFTWSADDIIPAAMCDTVGTAGDAYITPFIEAYIGRNRHFVFARGFKHLLIHPQKIEKVRFVSGTCLFSDRHLQAICRDGSRMSLLNPRVKIEKTIDKIIVNPALSFYEIEASIRLSRLLTDLVLSLPKGLPATITLDVPHGQYYCYLLNAYQNGFVGRDLLLYWFQIVHERHSQVINYMRRQLDFWFTAAGLPKPAIDVSGALAPVGEFLLASVMTGKVLKPPDLVAKLADYDEIWSLIGKVAPPESFLELIYISYNLEQLRSSLSIRTANDPLTLTIDVENREEQRIYESSLRLLPKIHFMQPAAIAPILGCYPLERFLVANIPKWGLYTSDPGNSFIDQKGKVYSAAELLGAVYGQQPVENNVSQATAKAV